MIDIANEAFVEVDINLRGIQTIHNKFGIRYFAAGFTIFEGSGRLPAQASIVMYLALDNSPYLQKAMKSTALSVEIILQREVIALHS